MRFEREETCFCSFDCFHGGYPVAWLCSGHKQKQIRHTDIQQMKTEAAGVELTMLWLGLVWSWFGVYTRRPSPQCVHVLAKLFAKTGTYLERRVGKRGLGAVDIHPPTPPADQGPADSHPALVGLVNWEDTSCVDFSILQNVIWPRVLLSCGPFLPAPSAETSCVIPSWSALLLPLFLGLPQKSILSFMFVLFMHKGTVVACCGAVPLHFHQWGFLSFSSKYYNGALKPWMANAECTILQSPLILFCRSQ